MNNDDLHGYYLEDLEVGMSASYAKTVTEADVILFAGISGDNNPLHLNEEFAATSPFKARIVHGLFTAALISTVAGTKLPGPGAVYLNQSLRFRAPVMIGDTVHATVTVREVIAEKRRLVCDTVCTVRGKVVLEGEALYMVDSRQARQDDEKRKAA